MKNIIISTTSNKPIYQQIYDQISTQIILKEIEAGSQLPSIRGAAKELRVSIITIKKTWEMLEQNNYIYTVPGKGSFVSKNTDSFLSDKKNEKVKGALAVIITECKSVGISKTELKDIIDSMYKE